LQVINELKELIENMDGWTLAVGKAEFEGVQKLMKALADEVDSHSFGLKANVKKRYGPNYHPTQCVGCQSERDPKITF